MTNILKYTTGTIATVLMLDALMFLMWAMSNQFPTDGFYFGALTANIIKLFI